MNKKHIILMILGVLLLAAFAIENNILPQNSLLTCEDIQETQLLVLTPSVLEGLVFTIGSCGLEKDHIYSIIDNNIGAMNVTFSNTRTFYFHYVLYEKDFNEDSTLQFWLFDNTTQEIKDTKMIVLKEVWS